MSKLLISILHTMNLLRPLLTFALAFLLTACTVGGSVHHSAHLYEAPASRTFTTTLDKSGNITQMTDARGVVSNYVYDSLNRVTSVSYPSAPALNVTVTYDAATNCGAAYKGRLCSITDAAGTTAYQYDVLGRITQKKDTRGGVNLITTTTYDLAGNVATITLPSGRGITYTRNANGRVTNVSAPVAGVATNLASSVTYLPFGQITSLTYGNAKTLSATFNQDYNPTNRTVAGIFNHTYVTNANGDVMQAGAATYGYDALNRTNAENTPAATTYTYDATDNRLTKVQGTTTTSTVPATSDKISAVGGSAYTYDANGNITTIGGTAKTYVWNAANQMSSTTVSGTTVGTYTYTATHQRAKKVAGATTTLYIYGIDGLLYGEYTTAGVLVREYVYLNGTPLAQINAGTPETITYLHTDHLGTPRFGTNSAGTQVWAWANDAFGTSAPTGTATVNLRMAGQYFDSESSLFYNWNRYYNPAIGRYISSDPIGLAGGLNTFSYVGQSPVNWVDPRGTCIGPLIAPCLMGAAWLTTNAPWVIPVAIGVTEGALSAVTGSMPMSAAAGSAALADDIAVSAPKVLPKVVKGGECPAASTPVGRSGNPMSVPSPQNSPGSVGNTNYTGHAFDQMQGRGITPSVIEDTIMNGVPSSGRGGATVFTTDQARVIVNSDGTIITVYPQ